MLVKHLSNLPSTRAADHSELREILHPDRDDVALGYSLAHAVVGPGASSLRHVLAATEVYYILSGRGTMHIDDGAAPVAPGDAVYIPSGATQWLESDGSEPVAFLCIVDPPWRPEHEGTPRRAARPGEGDDT